MTANNGWPGKPGVPLNTVDGRKLKADAGIPHLPTQLTYDCRLAISGQGPLAYTWEDKPHRLVYNLCREIERVAAAATPAEIAAKDALEAQLTALQRDASKQVATDELVRRLQHLGDWQAADRIEALQKRCEEAERTAIQAAECHARETRRADALQKRLAVLEEALRFYADPFKYTDIHGDDVRVPHFYSETDFGETARVALGLDEPWSLQP